MREGIYFFKLQIKNLSASGELTVNGPGLFDLRFSSPETLQAISFQVDRESAIVQFGDHKDVTAVSELPDASALKLLLYSLNEFLYKTHAFIIEADGYVSAQAQILQQTVRAVFSTDGRLLQINCDSANASICFKAPESAYSVQ